MTIFKFSLSNYTRRSVDLFYVLSKDEINSFIFSRLCSAKVRLNSRMYNGFWKTNQRSSSTSEDLEKGRKDSFPELTMFRVRFSNSVLSNLFDSWHPLRPKNGGTNTCLNMTIFVTKNIKFLTKQYK